MEDLTGSPLEDVGSQFDVTNLDANVQAATAVEKTWSAPALPDEVKIDLARQPGVTPEGLRNFLRQVDDVTAGRPDEDTVEEDQTTPTPQPDVNEGPGERRSGYDLARIVFNDVAGSSPPQEDTPDAVKRFKERAIRGGYLEDRGPVDSVWSPELNSIRYDMAFDEYDSAMRGDRYGAVDARTFLDTLGDWTQPTALLAAATELDLWWDFGAVGNEMSSWGDKWRKLQDSDSPWDWGKNLVDAVTGPIDDIVMPIVNWGLIASGVGGVYTTARLGAFGARGALAAAEGTSWLSRAYRATKLRNVTNLLQIGEESWTATKLLKSESTAAKAVGGALKAWRGNRAVMRTKQGVQAGMRLGVASQVEDLLPGYQGGQSLYSASSGVQEKADRLHEMGMSPVFMPLELALAPYNIFSPGTFIGKSGAISKTASGLYKFTGTTPGRAVAGAAAGAAIGTATGDDAGDIATGALLGGAAAAAAPAVGKGFTMLGARAAAAPGRLGKPIAAVGRASEGVGSFLEHSSFIPIADNQRTSNAFDKVMRRYLAADPQSLDRYNEAWKSKKTLSGAVGEWAGTDDEGGAAIITWMMMSAALDNSAAAKASLIQNGSRDARFFNFRNQGIGQLRTFDLDRLDEEGGVAQWIVEDLVTSHVMTASSMESPQKYAHEWDRVWKLVKDDPTAILEMANTHNANAQRFMEDLVDTLDEEVLYQYMGDTIDRFGRWDLFTSADAEVTDLMHAGLLDEAEFLPIVNRAGNTAKFRLGAPREATATRLIRDGLNENIISETTNMAQTATNRNISTLVSQTTAGRTTVARLDTPIAQDLVNVEQELRGWRAVYEGLRDAHHHGVKWDDVAAAADRPLHELEIDELKQAINAVTGSDKYAGTYMELVRIAQKNEIDPQDLLTRFDAYVNEMMNDATKWERLGLSPVVQDGDGQVLSGLSAMKRRIKDLAHKAHYTAAEIDVDGLVQKLTESGRLEEARRVQDVADGLREDGYKLVHGKEFIMPHDLNQDLRPFKDMTIRHRHAQTMGNFFARKLPREGRMIEDRRQRMAMARSLSKNLGRDLNVDSPEVDGVLRDMHAILKNIQNESSSNIDKLWQQNWFRRRIAALDTSFTPLRLDDMTARQDEIIQGLMDLGHDEKTAWAAWEAVPKMRNAEFQDLGLYALEAWLRSENQAAQFLKFATGGQGKGLISGRAAYTAAGGYIGYEAGGNFGPEGEDANFGAQIAGAAAGALAGYGAARLGTKAVNKEFGRSARSIMRRTELNRHGYLADELVRIRDAMRFTLSPFFDISRYTEGLMLAQTAAPQRGLNGERLALHLNMAPRALRKRFIKTLGKGVSNTEAQRKAHAWFDEERELFRHAARGDFDPDVLDSTGKWFSQIGIMGFNPTDWMTAAFIELRQVGGLDSETAYKAVREMYTYGTKGRSAAELSTNFVFFPFSFQKKALTHLTKWTQSDLGRSILLHDAMKTYDILDAKYDLNTYWEEHIPMLKQLQKLNLFAYGISPGRFGGINRPFLDPLAKAGTAYAQALFTPTGASIKDAAAAAELQDVMRSLTPALNDINWMVEESKQQFNVFTSQSHVTIDAEISKGYEEWTQIRDDYSRLLEQHGYTWGDLKNKPYLAPQHAQYEAARAQLAQKYPAWFDSRTRSTQNRVALEMEKNDRLSRAETGEGVTRSDIHLAEMENLLNTLRSEGELRNMRFGGNDGWEDAPPAVFEVVQREAQRRVRQDPKFKGIWNKFYARDFGPLEAQL